MELEGGQK